MEIELNQSEDVNSAEGDTTSDGKANAHETHSLDDDEELSDPPESQDSDDCEEVSGTSEPQEKDNDPLTGVSEELPLNMLMQVFNRTEEIQLTPDDVGGV